MGRATPSVDVVVAGAGPAGATVALGLARLGYQVSVAAVPRSFAACEGISDRVLAGLQGVGFRHALSAIPDPAPRSVVWNGTERAANAERLVLREDLDTGIRRDLLEAGIEVHDARVAAVQSPADGDVHLSLDDGSTLTARFFVEARGRAAPRAAASRSRGPETVSLMQAWQGSPGRSATRVFAFRDGWAWLARVPDGLLYTQLMLAADAEGIPKREALAGFVRERLRALPDAAEWLSGAEPCGEPVARASTAVLHAPVVERGQLRVGDAAMGVDPLSGNGIFQALSSATVAPAVINTLLREPHHVELALGFYRERIAQLYQRFARIGRDFYRGETRWSGHAFWRERGAWPDAEPAHASNLRVLGEAQRAVVERGFIRERAVVLTSDQPQGVWRVQGVEIAPLLRDLPTQDAGAELERRIAAYARDDTAVQRALRSWCARHGLSRAMPPDGT